MHAADDSVGDGRVKIGRQQKRIPDGVGPVTDLNFVAVTDLGEREIVPAEQFNQRDVARWIDTDDHGVIEDTVVQPALHEVARAAGDVKIAQCITVRADHDS